MELLKQLAEKEPPRPGKPRAVSEYEQIRMLVKALRLPKYLREECFDRPDIGSVWEFMVENSVLPKSVSQYFCTLEFYRVRHNTWAEMAAGCPKGSFVDLMAEHLEGHEHALYATGVFACRTTPGAEGLTYCWMRTMTGEPNIVDDEFLRPVRFSSHPNFMIKFVKRLDCLVGVASVASLHNVE